MTPNLYKLTLSTLNTACCIKYKNLCWKTPIQSQKWRFYNKVFIAHFEQDTCPLQRKQENIPLYSISANFSSVAMQKDSQSILCWLYLWLVFIHWVICCSGYQLWANIFKTFIVSLFVIWLRFQTNFILTFRTNSWQSLNFMYVRCLYNVTSTNFLCTFNFSCYYNGI